jgi:hypothetical protein
MSRLNACFVVLLILFPTLVQAQEDFDPLESITISADTTFANVYIREGVTFTADGHITVLGDFTVFDDGIVTHTAGSTHGLHLTVEGSLLIETGGLIHGNSRGVARWGQYGNEDGGCYGGVGSSSPQSRAYGVVEEALSLGDGGHDSVGGGLVHIQADVVQIDGEIQVIGRDGYNSNCGFGNRPGGGSGGSIQIEARVLGGTGALRANGGNGSCPTSNPGGGGGGGRIALFYDEEGASFPSAEALGNGANNSVRGSAGSIYMRPSRFDTEVPGSLFIANNNRVSSTTAPLLTNLVEFAALSIRANGRLAASGLSGAPGSVSVGTPVLVDGGGYLSLGDINLSLPLGASPDIQVSGSGSAFTMLAGSTLDTGTSIEVSGGAMTTAVDLAFEESTDFTLNGGSLTIQSPAVVFLPSFTSDNIQAGFVDLQAGGRLHVGDESITIGAGVELEKDGYFGASDDVIGNLDVAGDGIITHSAGLEAGLYLNVSETISVQTDGLIHGNSRGVARWGQYGNEEGGCFGGVGGGAPVSRAYGVAEEALSLGDGGHDSVGGGFVHIQADVVQIDGEIQVIGRDGYNSNCGFGNRPGGGSGGSIQIEARVLGGTGALRANGGNGSCPTSNPGGGGGGGRIALFYDEEGASFPSAEALGNGANNSVRGSAGSIYMRPSRFDTEVPGSLFIANNNRVSSTTAPLLTNLVEFAALSIRANGRLAASGLSGAPGSVSVGTPVLVDGGGYLSLGDINLSLPLGASPDIQVSGSGSAFTMLAGSTLDTGTSIEVSGGAMTTAVDLAFEESTDFTLNGGSLTIQSPAVVFLPSFTSDNIQAGFVDLQAGGRLHVGDESITIGAGVELEKDGYFGASDDVIGNLDVAGDGIITHSAGLEAGLYLNVSETISVQTDGLIHGNSRGVARWGQYGNEEGGCFGGVGGGAPVSRAYGVAEEALSLGDGGHDSVGGGFVHIQADVVQIDGEIQVIGRDGYNSNCGFGNRPGGGSGGSIQIEARVLGGTGALRANGGNGSCPTSNPGGGGGGGRIALFYDEEGASFPSAEALGNGANNSVRGSAGSIYMRPSRFDTEVPGSLFIANNNRVSSTTAPLLTNLVEFAALSIRANGRLAASGLSGAPGSVSVGTPVLVDGGGYLSLGDINLSLPLGASPDIQVSGSGSAFTMLAGSTLDTGTSIEVSGGAMTTAVDLAFEESTDFTLNGGSLTIQSPAVVFLPSFTSDNIQAGFVDLQAGGRLHVGDESITIGAGVELEKDGYFGASDDVIGNLDVAGDGIITHSAGLEAGLYLNVSETISVQTDGLIHGNSRGVARWGQYGNEEGGCFGGVGGGAPVSRAYGVAEEALSLGDGGHDSVGGGFVHIQADVVQIDGEIQVIGRDGYNSNCGFGNRPGGGSGGSIQIEARVLGGTGALRANGGNGSCPTSNPGGGGGGGRIALFYDEEGASFPSAEALGKGANIWVRGSAGTIYMRPSRSGDDGHLGRVIVDNGQASSNQTTPMLHGTSSYFDLNVVAPSVLSITEPFYQPEGAVTLDDATIQSDWPFTLIDSGVLDGTGTVNADIINAGLVSPGTSPGEIILNGDLTCTQDGTIDIEISGYTPVTEHDLLQVNGQANFDGTLSITLDPAFEPEHLDFFQAMEYESHTGRFTTIDGPVLPGTLEWRVLYGDTDLKIYTIDPVIIRPDSTGTFETIQDAIDAVPEGTIIELAADTTGDNVFTGEGNVNLDFGGKNLILQSLTGDPADCVIDCEDSARALYLHSGENSETIIQNITIRNGLVDDTRSPGGGRGGAILIDGAAPTLRNIILAGCRASTGGGGLHLEATSGVNIFDFEFFDNQSSTGGGGLHLEATSDVAIIDCEFAGNSSSTGGGGLHLESNSGTEILGSTIYDNGSSTGGGGLHLSATSLTMELTTVAYNDAPAGAGALLENESSLVGSTSLIAFNGVASGGSAVHCLDTSTASLSCSDVYGNGGGDWTGCLLGQDVENNNLWVDPLFCGSSDPFDLQLDSTSLCAASNNPDCGQIGALPVGCSAEFVQLSPDGTGDFANLADAIASLNGGEVLLLAPGVYEGEGNRDISLPSLDIRIRRQPTDRSDGPVVINCAGADTSLHRAFIIDPGGNGGTPVLEGLTLTGGWEEMGGGYPGLSRSPSAAEQLCHSREHGHPGWWCVRWCGRYPRPGQLHVP